MKTTKLILESALVASVIAVVGCSKDAAPDTTATAPPAPTLADATKAQTGKPAGMQAKAMTAPPGVQTGIPK
jgi:hypothetical protein